VSGLPEQPNLVLNDPVLTGSRSREVARVEDEDAHGLREGRPKDGDRNAYVFQLGSHRYLHGFPSRKAQKSTQDPILARRHEEPSQKSCLGAAKGSLERPTLERERLQWPES
jgi:hypothetical protein